MNYVKGDKVVIYISLSLIPAIAIIEEKTKTGYWVRMFPNDRYHVLEKHIQGYLKEYTALDLEGKRD